MQKGEGRRRGDSTRAGAGAGAGAKNLRLGFQTEPVRLVRFGQFLNFKIDPEPNCLRVFIWLIQFLFLFWFFDILVK